MLTFETIRSSPNAYRYLTPWVRRQENSSFANFGCVSACGVCKCAVLCVGCSFIWFSFFCLLVANCLFVSVFLHLAVTDGGMKRSGLRHCVHITRYNFDAG